VVEPSFTVELLPQKSHFGLFWLTFSTVNVFGDWLSSLVCLFSGLVRFVCDWLLGADEQMGFGLRLAAGFLFAWGLPQSQYRDFSVVFGLEQRKSRGTNRLGRQ